MNKLINFLNKNKIKYVKSGDILTVNLKGYDIKIIQGDKKFYVEKFKSWSSCSPLVEIKTQTAVIKTLDNILNNRKMALCFY